MIPWRNRIELYPKQQAAIGDPPDHAIVLASPKAGKAQPLDALVYTPTGPVPMGKLAIGDEVLTPDGTTTRVVGIFPQGVQPIYRVSFSDGRSTECTADHLWEIHMREDAGSDWPRIAPLTEVVGLSDDYHKRCWIPTAAAVAYDSQPIPIDPYLLGVLLGDGSIKTSVSISLPDDYIRERVEAAIPEDHKLVYRDQYDWSIITRSNWQHHPERLHVRLRDLGLWGKGSPEKFIPEIYKYNSAEVRIEMLRGLLDTDGWVDSKGQPHFDSSSKLLSDDVRELVEGLGGFAYYGLKHVAGHHDSHRLAIVHPDAPSLFSLPRKRNAARPKKKPSRRKFREIELVRRAEAQCIQVADPRGLYLTDHMITTHNTIACLQWLIEETERIGRAHRRFLWVAPTFGQSKIAFRRAYQEVLDLEQIQIHKTDHTITMPNETVIFFGSADKPDNIYGEDYHAVVVDEATRASLESWIAITSTTQHTAARFRLIGNNTRRANWAKKLAKRAQKGELPGWTYTQLHREDAIKAGVVSSEQDAMTQLLIPEDDYNILYRGLDSDDGTIRIDTFKLQPAPLPEVCMKVRGWDFSASESGDWTVGALIRANSEGFWIEDIKRERLAPEDVVDYIRQVAAVDGPDVEQVAEEEKGASGILFVETLRRELDAIPTAGPVYPAPVEQNKIVRAWPFATAVKRGRYSVAPEGLSGEVLEELDEWPDSTFDDVVDAIAHAHNHVAPLVAGLVGSGWVPQ